MRESDWGKGGHTAMAGSRVWASGTSRTRRRTTRRSHSPFLSSTQRAMLIGSIGTVTYSRPEPPEKADTTQPPTYPHRKYRQQCRLLFHPELYASVKTGNLPNLPKAQRFHIVHISCTTTTTTTTTTTSSSTSSHSHSPAQSTFALDLDSRSSASAASATSTVNQAHPHVPPPSSYFDFKAFGLASLLHRAPASSTLSPPSKSIVRHLHLGNGSGSMKRQILGFLGKPVGAVPRQSACVSHLLDHRGIGGGVSRTFRLQRSVHSARGWLEGYVMGAWDAVVAPAAAAQKEKDMGCIGASSSSLARALEVNRAGAGAEETTWQGGQGGQDAVKREEGGGGFFGDSLGRIRRGHGSL
ncbi:hypothetical protein DFP72DRAFT_1137517 [Ephemerocybe angulata]|uniref:Uncharacterized protein n=1 Tax=Ephemerocybe angulata TaxID=980116 RepID=A0A8H6M416_9AGAR|nr:hypothetical protein DFP72DRAFT_1137517 [Tulosesus angulatus]